MPTNITRSISRAKTYAEAQKKKPTVRKPVNLDYVPGSAQSPFPQTQQQIKDQAFIRRYQPGGANDPAKNPPIRTSGPAGTGSAAGSAFSPSAPSQTGWGSVSAAAVPSSTGGQMNGGATGLDQELTGWAEGLKPDMLTGLMFGNQEAFLRQILNKMGMDPDENIGALMAAAPYIQGMNQLALVMLGADPDFEAGDMNSAFNWLGDFASQGMTPGGDLIDFSQGLGNLVGAGSGGDSMNALESYMNINDPQGQVDAMMSLAAPLAQASLHPYWAQALMSEMSRQGDAWVSKSSSNNMDGAFNEFFKRRMGY